jgi:hypothetical protein
MLNRNSLPDRRASVRASELERGDVVQGDLVVHEAQCGGDLAVVAPAQDDHRCENGEGDSRGRQQREKGPAPDLHASAAA